MKSRYLIFFIPLIILQMIFLPLPLYSAEEDLFKENRGKGIAFMSGGVSQTERQILRERKRIYPKIDIFQ